MNRNQAMESASSPSAGRIAWLDSSRCLAFLMVIYSHTVFCDETVMKFFGPVYLSIFFFVSGYLTKEGLSFSKYAEQRARTLFLPFLLWGLLLFVKRHIFSLTSETGEWGHDLWLFFLQDGRDNYIWFIPALFAYSLIFYPFLKYCRNGSGLLLALAAFCGVNYIYLYVFVGPALPYHLDTAGFACLLMGLGKVYRRHESRLEGCFRLDLAAIALAAYLLVCNYNPARMNYFGSPQMYNWIVAVGLGIYLMIFVSRLRIFINSFTLKIGANTLICFILHGQVYAVIEKIAEATGLLSRAGAIFPTSQCFAAAETLLTAALLLIPIWIINRWLPWSIGKGFKLWRAE